MDLYYISRLDRAPIYSSQPASHSAIYGIENYNKIIVRLFTNSLVQEHRFIYAHTHTYGFAEYLPLQPPP